MWIVRRWRSIGGAISFFPSLCVTFWHAVGHAGDVDFFLAHVRDWGWAGEVIAWLLNPPVWSLVPMILAGLALIFWDTKRHRVPSGAVPRLRVPEPVAASAARAKPIDRTAPPQGLAREPISPATRWDKYSASDLERINDALYAMYEMLSARASRTSEAMYQHLNNFQSEYAAGQDKYPRRLRDLHWSIRHLIGDLSELQYKIYELYSTDLSSVYDNLGLSDFTGKIEKFIILIEGLGGPPTGTSLGLILEKRDEAEAHVREFNGWIAQSKASVIAARKEVAESLKRR